MNFAKKTLILLLFLLKFAHAKQEKLVSKHLDKGVFYFQLQNAEENLNYRLEIIDLKNKKIVDKLTKWKKTDVFRVLKLRWEPKLKQGVYYWNLYRDDKLISAHLPKFKTPKEFNQSIGKVRRSEFSLKWQLNKAAIARVFVVNTSGMVVAKVVNWKFYPAGEQSTKWDFWDNDGVKLYSEVKGIGCFAQFVSLGERIIVIGKPKFNDFSNLKLFSKLELDSFNYNFELKAPENKKAKNFSKKSPHYIAETGMPITITLDPKTVNRLGNERFEFLLYLNGDFIHEESQGVSPYQFVLPDFNKIKGIHYLTANLLDYNGNMRSKTIFLNFK